MICVVEESDDEPVAEESLPQDERISRRIDVLMNDLTKKELQAMAMKYMIKKGKGL